MICPKCGTANKNEAVYCKKCGTKLPVYEDEEPIEEWDDDEDGGILSKILIVTGIVVLLAVIVVAGVLIITKLKPFQRQKESTEVGVIDNDSPGKEDEDDFDEGTTEDNGLGLPSGQEEQEDSQTPSDPEKPVPGGGTDPGNDPNPPGGSTAPSGNGINPSGNDTNPTGGNTPPEEEKMTPIKIANQYKDKAVKNPMEYGGHAYAVFDFHKLNLSTFDDCEEFCEECGGHMAVISSEKENDAIYNYVQKDGVSHAFFGYTDQDSEGNWRWVDGSATEYTNWCREEGDEQPNNRKGIEHYAQFFGEKKDGTWCDADFGSGSWKFVCEWE